MNTVWVLDDDKSVLGLYRFLLEEEGYAVSAFSAARELLEGLPTARPDMVIVDLGLPDASGIEVCRQIRHTPGLENVPLVVVTASHELSDRYTTLATGADDFLTKPVDNTELVLRVRNLMRRATGGPASVPAADGGHGGPGGHDGHDGHKGHHDVLQALDMELYLRTYEVSVDSRVEALTPSEFAILRHLMERSGEPVSVETLLVEALGYPPRLGNPEVLRTHVRHLRRKIESNPETPRRLLNRPRLGYMVPSH